MKKSILAALLVLLACASVSQAQHKRAAVVRDGHNRNAVVIRQAVVVNRGLNLGYSYGYAPQVVLAAPALVAPALVAPVAPVESYATPAVAAPAVEAIPAYAPAYTPAPAFQLVPAYSAFSAFSYGYGRQAVVVRRGAIILRR